jgi:PIN domain nuclease of toxin-antitoxin system
MLLDTHVWLWANLEPARLSVAVREELVRAENDVLVSVASIWELGIKHRLGKIALEGEFSAFVRDAVEGLSVLEVRQAHAVRVHALPQHHRDPFDRLLIAQAFEEGATLVTADGELDAYGVSVLRT